MLQWRKEGWLIATWVFANLIASQVSFSSPTILSKDPALMAFVPAKSFQGIGSWSAGAITSRPASRRLSNRLERKRKRISRKRLPKKMRRSGLAMKRSCVKTRSLTKNPTRVRQSFRDSVSLPHINLKTETRCLWLVWRRKMQ